MSSDGKGVADKLQSDEERDLVLYDPSLIALVETRVCGRCANSVIRHLGFDISFRVEARGFRGGLWILWKSSIDVRFLCLSNQYVHMEILEHGMSSPVFVTTVYGSPSIMFCKYLWSQLEDLDPSPEKPWVLGGDFNAISNAEDMRRGSLSRSGISKGFSNFIFDTSVVDVPFWGPRFTWSRGLLFQRLDRVFMNAKWASTFLDSVVWHLEKVGQRKRKILARLRGIDHALNYRYSEYLIGLEKSLKGELDIVLEQEESLWAQKSRCNWYVHGDHNTKYFHACAKSRRRSNSILALRDEHESWCSDQRLLWGLAPLVSDSIGWGGDDRRMFTVKSAYSLRACDAQGDELQLWKAVSKYRGLPRIRMFLWLVFKRKILTNSEHVRRHMSINSCCGLCGALVEDLSHLFRDCVEARLLWTRVVKEEKLDEFLTLDFQAWLVANIQNQQSFLST
ncbi:hypothetical protein GQ457_16G019810 [Hibiscus cannabinus]